MNKSAIIIVLLVSSTLFPQNKRAWQNPLPQGNNLNSIYFSNFLFYK